MTDEMYKKLVKIKRHGDELIAVMPNGEEIPCVMNITIESEAGEQTTVTIRLVADLTIFENTHK